MGNNQHPKLEWRGDVPVALAFDDPYFSLENGLAETRHVFLSGNGLPARFRDGFHIAELGFGTGLSCLTALGAWLEAGCDGVLRFTSFEAFPLPVVEMERALSGFPELAELSKPILAAFATGHSNVMTDHLILEVIEGDARQTLPKWKGAADAWFLDGFAPARNPELWELGLLTEVVRHTLPGGTAATYSAAGAVRRALADAGFTVDRAPGFGRKRHMTVARL